MTASAFRHHDHVPPGITSPLYRRLITEWVALNQAPASVTTLAAWARTEPVLTGYTRPGDVIDAIDTAPPPGQDALLLALVRLAQAGHQLAGRVVLQAMLPKLGKMSCRTPGTTSDDAWAEDRHHITVATCWDVITTYNTDRRTTTVAGNLAMDTLNALTRPARRPRPVETPTDPATLAAVDIPTGEPAEPGELTVDADLAELLGWALGHGHVTPDEATVLRLVYTPDDDGAAGSRSETAARQLGLSAAAVRQRCARTRRKLQRAVQESAF